MTIQQQYRNERHFQHTIRSLGGIDVVAENHVSLFDLESQLIEAVGADQAREIEGKIFAATNDYSEQAAQIQAAIDDAQPRKLRPSRCGQAHPVMADDPALRGLVPDAHNCNRPASEPGVAEADEGFYMRQDYF